MFIFLCWPSMVPNQRQLSIIVSNCRSYLGSPFSHLLLWDLVFLCCMCCTPSFTFVDLFIVFGGTFKTFKKMYTYHAAPWSSFNDGRYKGGFGRFQVYCHYTVTL